MNFKFNFEELKSQVSEVLTYSQSLDFSALTDDLMEKWLKGKERFIEAFDGNLIYELPDAVTYKINESQKVAVVDGFLEWLDESNINEDLVTFLLMQKIESIDSFYKNKTTCTATAPDGMKIIPGMKLSKACKHYLTDKEEIERVQNKLSEVIQLKRITGKLCVSVHPLDFLSVSDNDSGWTSCHSIVTGTSKSGNLSLMEDSSTFMVYIKSDKGNVRIPGFPESIPWNSKKWRTFIFQSEDEDMLITGKQYPFSADEVLRGVIKDVFPKINYGDWLDWMETQIDCFDMTPNKLYPSFDSPYIWTYGKGGELKTLREIIKPQGFLFYCDVLENKKYKPLYTFKRKKLYSDTKTRAIMKPPSFIVGKKDVKCISCESETIGNGATMLCLGCELELGRKIIPEYIERCSLCDERYSYIDLEGVDGQLLCPTCYENETFVCSECFQVHLLEYNMGNFICDECYTEEKE